MKRFVLLIILLAALCNLSIAKNSNDSTTAKKINDWTTVQLVGKLRMAGLPISPTTTMTMSNGREISISIRAPFVGEVGKLSLTQDSLIILNKMKKVYAIEPTTALSDLYPSFLPDLQSLFLARPILNPSQIEGVNYDHAFNTDESLSKLTITAEDENNTYIFSAIYVYFNDLYDIYFNLSKDGKKRGEVILNLDAIKWNVPESELITIPHNFKRVNLRQAIAF